MTISDMVYKSVYYERPLIDLEPYIIRFENDPSLYVMVSSHYVIKTDDPIADYTLCGVRLPDDEDEWTNPIPLSRLYGLGQIVVDEQGLVQSIVTLPVEDYLEGLLKARFQELWTAEGQSYLRLLWKVGNRVCLWTSRAQMAWIYRDLDQFFFGLCNPGDGFPSI